MKLRKKIKIFDIIMLVYALAVTFWALEWRDERNTFRSGFMLMQQDCQVKWEKRQNVVVEQQKRL